MLLAALYADSLPSSGMMPFGGAGGSGIVIARLPDGSECKLVKFFTAY